MKKNIRKALSIHTIQGRVTYLVGFFLLVLLIVAWLVTSGNRNVIESEQKITSQLTPAALNSIELLNGINASSAAIRGFLLTKRQNYLDRWEDIWEAQIMVSLEKLKALALTSEDEESFSASISEVEELLFQYKELQQAQRDMILQEVEEMRENGLQNATDSASLLAFSNQQLQELEETRQILDADIQSRVSPIKAELNQKLVDLSKAQQKELATQLQDLEAKVKSLSVTVVIICLIMGLLAVFIAYLIIQKLIQSVKTVTHTLDELSVGSLDAKTEKLKDELNIVTIASNKLISYFSNASNYAQRIGEGKYNEHFQAAGTKDVLGNSLLQMGQKLAKISDAEQKRAWAAEGMAHFAGILRDNTKDMATLGDKVLASLVKYLDANQAGLFIASDKDYGKEGYKYLELVSSFAYERKKFMSRIIEVSEDFAEGLVGQVFLEQETVYMTEIPNGYVHITSGLGHATPTALLLVPLKVNEHTAGVLEIASFNEFEPHEIEFLERVCESIASSILNVKRSVQTQKLLEASQEQAEMLRAQEEEMRQNVEELSATQEEMRRKSLSMEKLLAESQEKEQALALQRIEAMQRGAKLNSFIQSADDGIMALDHELKVTLVNDKMKMLLNTDKEIVPGKTTAEELLSADTWAKEKAFLFDALQGKKGGKEEVIQLNGHTVHLQVKFNPIWNADGKADGVSVTYRDITQLVEQQRELKSSEESHRSLTKNVPGVIYQFKLDPKTQHIGFTFVSEQVEKLFGITPLEVVGMGAVDSLPIQVKDEHLKSFQEKLLASAEALSRFSWEGQAKARNAPDSNFKWIRAESMPHLQEDQTILWDGIFMDIALEKEQQDALNQLNKSLLQTNEIVQALQGMVFYCDNDADWTMRMVSKGSEQLTGYIPEDFTSGKQVFADLVVDEDQEFLAKEIAKQIAATKTEGGKYAVKYRIKDRFGNRKILLEKGKGIFDTNGNVSHLVGFIIDISDLREHTRSRLAYAREGYAQQ